MNKNTVVEFSGRGARDELTELMRVGARQLIAQALEAGPLKKFYQSITRSEKRHFQLFLDLAKTYLPAATVATRWRELLEVEAGITARLPIRAALH